MKIKVLTRAKLIIIIGSAIALTGCSLASPIVETRTVYREVPVESTKADVPPGVVEYVWEEPMIDVVDVPPGLDPEGHYYRPAHQAVTEIRQGRWRHYRAGN
ncbi:MAG: hypothetical protein SGJ02_14210 [bacterium]|nr:hypothetical protein [bacterium]